MEQRQKRVRQPAASRLSYRSRFISCGAGAHALGTFSYLLRNPDRIPHVMGFQLSVKVGQPSTGQLVIQSNKERVKKSWSMYKIITNTLCIPRINLLLESSRMCSHRELLPMKQLSLQKGLNPASHRDQLMCLQYSCSHGFSSGRVDAPWHGTLQSLWGGHKTCHMETRPSQR